MSRSACTRLMWLRSYNSVIALANNCLHLRSLNLYYCRNITDRAMYALAHIRVKNKNQMWDGVKTGDEDEDGLMSLSTSVNALL
ncbi:putative leucine-rich repeat domain superfamily [Helianthus annuus]|nr:putative leucine-rich repeat domain superfamily [Helianthus annuus]KAJ0558588.1 putative leucine-rich repeat domain superfamily [Helianthus annuus]KAJ0564496.1 putative leucine-rich repeat domain superfamily [Helianthus annuus]